MNSKILGGILLVAGTAIGAGMLALPVVTGFAGLIPSIFLFLIYWVYMIYTAFLTQEVTMWMGPHTNLISMARHTLGKPGEYVSWVVFLFLLYALTTAYIAGAAPLLLQLIEFATGWNWPDWVGGIPLIAIFGFFVYQGTRSVDYINRLLMIGLTAAFILLVFTLLPHVQSSLLARADWPALRFASSVIATSFGFHIIIPSLTFYLDRDSESMKKVILIGGSIPLFIYILWEVLTLGIIPLETIQEGFERGEDGAKLLAGILNNPVLSVLARCFSFFAIITSFMGVALSLTDFLADGFKIEKTRQGRILLYLLAFIPPFLITLYDPRAFISALEYAGAFGVVILLGILPALMVWSGRYRMHLVSQTRAPGGKLALSAAIVFSLLVIGIEIYNKVIA